MNYIVLDLEWNQPISKKAYPYVKIGKKLAFEILQIGAVKLNESLEIVDTFNMYIKPRYYKRVHPKVMKIISIDKEELKNGSEFPEAVDDFRKWCGDDFIFLTWGNDDISVLKQNLVFYKKAFSWTDKWYNLQYIFNNQFDLGTNQRSLDFAVDFFGVIANLNYHDALNDAYYTALVCGCLDIEKGIKNYTLPGSIITDTSGFGEFETKALALNSKNVCKIQCPECKAVLCNNVQWLHQNGYKYVTLINCKSHGVFLVRLRLKKNAQNHWFVNRIIKRPDENTISLFRRRKLKIPDEIKI